MQRNGPAARTGYTLRAERTGLTHGGGDDEAYPSNKFGANAAWLRLQMLTHNRLELLKAAALDAEYRRARPKRLRFAILTQFGRVVRHAREQYVRVVTRVLARVLAPGLWRLQCCAWPVGP